MQSYQIHVVSEHLKDRHPYLELPFRERQDHSKVRLAVQDRSIPKLIEILLMPGIEHYKYRDALITLNEIVSHQESKNEMISQGLFGIASAFLHSNDVDIREQAALLVGSLASIIRFKAFFDERTEEGLAKMLLDQHIKAKEACGWAINRIVSSRIGVQLLTTTKLIETMIISFIKHTDEPQLSEAIFVIYLLQSFSSIFQSDQGIAFSLGKGLTKRLNTLLKEQLYIEDSFRERVNYLCLDCLGKIAQNLRGKEECIQQKVIATAKDFLTSDVFLQKKYSLVLIMFCAIALKGKQQCIYDEDGINRSIIQSLYILVVEEDKTIRSNCIEALRSIAQLKDGFLAITSELGCNNKEYLEQIFGANVVIALAELLPKPSTLPNPPIIEDFQSLNSYKELCKTLCHMILNSPGALKIALQQTVEVVLKLVPYMIYKGDKQLQSTVSHSIVKICEEDQYSSKLVRSFIDKYGRVEHPSTKSTLSSQFSCVKGLADILNKA